MSETLIGRGMLHFRDGREWGLVDYHLNVTMSPIRIGSIRGSLSPVDPERGEHAPFYDIMEAGSLANLRLESGRWWGCLVQPDGRAVASSPAPEPDGFHAEQPTGT